MPLSVKTNQLTGPAATGTQATTDPAFQPKALFVWNGLQTATGAIADAQFSLGVASSTTTETAAGYDTDDNVATSDTVRFFNTARLGVNFTAGTTTTNIVYDLASFDASGFTTNWTTLSTANPLFNYLAIGGSGITNAKSGSFASNLITGNQAVTGLGFQPDIVFLFTTLQTTSAQSNNNSQYGLGVMSPLAQWTVSVKNQNSQATMNTSRAFQDNRCLAIPNTTTNGLFQEMSYVSMDADGFTVNIDVAGGSAILVGYLAIKGGQWKVGTETQKTSTGTKATTGVGFQPKGLIMASVCDTQTAGTADHARLCFGASTGVSNNVSIWTGDADNTADSIANTIMSNDKCLVLATEGTLAAPTTNSAAALSSFDSDGFTLDWTTADATARVFGYVAFGDSINSYTADGEFFNLL